MTFINTTTSNSVYGSQRDAMNQLQHSFTDAAATIRFPSTSLLFCSYTQLGPDHSRPPRDFRIFRISHGKYLACFQTNSVKVQKGFVHLCNFSKK